jgi:hypothetical protein
VGVLVRTRPSKPFRADGRPRPIRTASCPSTAEFTRLTRRQRGAVRLSVVASWSGRILLALAVAALVLGAMWTAADVVLLGGAYAITGSFMSVVGAKAW